MYLEEIERFVEEDLGPDPVSVTIVPLHRVVGVIRASEEGIICGVTEARATFEYFEVEVLKSLEAGSDVRGGDEVMRVAGPARGILAAERLALNFLGRMSGIATLTNQIVKKAPGVRVAATRKTTPGFRRFEKKAVIVGGGDPHRYTLSDAVMIKDNHIAIMGLEGAIEAARSASFTQKIEVEVESPEDAVHAAELGADIVMLDNMPPNRIRETIALLESKNLRKGLLIEASGGITLENASDYASTGVDVISLGALTRDARWLDLSLEVQKV